MYERDTDEDQSLDLGELRKMAHELLDRGDYEIAWPHLVEARHDPTEEEILVALRYGWYQHHEE